MSVRRISAKPWTLTASAFVLSLVGCVGRQPEDALGQAQFVSSNLPATADYAPSAATGAAGRANTPPVGTTGTAVAGSVSQPPGGTVPPPPAAAASGGAPRAGSQAPAAGGVGGGVGAAGGRAGSAGAAPVAGMGATAGAAAPVAGAAAPGMSAGMLSIDFKSVTSNGQYAPRNVGAVWIETSGGKFVKTLERWGNIRANHLTAWNAASGGWGSRFGGGGNTADMMDAVSRATLRSHEMHHDMWNMKDGTGQIVPDGMYNVVVEVTEDERRAGPVARVAFVKGPAPQMINAPDTGPFSGFVLSYQP